MSPADRLTLAARSDLAVCNLSEFAETAAAAGIVCPDDERTANLQTVAAALRTFQSRITSGNLVVTLGRRGAIAAKNHGGTVGHISVRLTPAQRERLAFLKAAPERRRGAGARFFAALAEKLSRTGDLFGAARHASAIVINTCARALNISTEQTAVRLFAV
jgi:sugar/nucleoside kinase (ribokinase family)